MLRVVRLRSDRLFLPFEGMRGTTFAKQAVFVPQGSPQVSTHRRALVHPQESSLKWGFPQRPGPLTQGFNNPGPV
jgi:hypothetical protein